MNDARTWIENKARDSLNPPQVETALLEVSKNWQDASRSFVDAVGDFPLGERVLLHLLAISSVSATRLAQHPDLLSWLSDPDVSLISRDGAQMVGDLQAIAGDDFADDNFKALRVWKNRQLTRIALRDVADAAPIEETT